MDCLEGCVVGVWWHLCHGQSTTTKPPPSPSRSPCTTQSIALLMGNYKLKSNSWNRYRHCARTVSVIDQSLIGRLTLWPGNGLKNHIDTYTQRWQLSKSYWAIALAIVESRLRCAKTQKLYRDNNSPIPIPNSISIRVVPFDNQMSVWSARWVWNLLRVSSFIHLFIQFWVHSSCTHIPRPSAFGRTSLWVMCQMREHRPQSVSIFRFLSRLACLIGKLVFQIYNKMHLNGYLKSSHKFKCKCH